MGTEAEEKSALLSAKKRQLRLRATILATIGSLFLLYWERHEHEFVVDFINGPADAEGYAAAVEQGTADPSLLARHVDPLARFENCTVSFQSPPTKQPGEWSTKPLWFPSHPNTIEDSLHKQLVNSITGLKAGGKSFYSSSKVAKLKQCFGQTETATCLNVHPIVDMGRKHPGTRADKFHDKYILGLRNPMTNLPAFHNGKAIKYHGLCEGCQVPENEWRKHRDEWVTEMLNGWTNVITTWGELKEYKVGMYLVYEHLFDPVKGPDMLQKLASLLKDAGFITARVDDIPCIWYKTMGKDIHRAYHDRPYEYKDYIPGYTVAQREAMLEQFNTLVEEQANDTDLVAILRGYQNDIRASTRIDTEWTNETTNENGTKVRGGIQRA